MFFYGTIKSIKVLTSEGELKAVSELDSLKSGPTVTSITEGLTIVYPNNSGLNIYNPEVNMSTPTVISCQNVIEFNTGVKILDPSKVRYREV